MNRKNVKFDLLSQIKILLGLFPLLMLIACGSQSETTEQEQISSAPPASTPPTPATLNITPQSSRFSRIKEGATRGGGTRGGQKSADMALTQTAPSFSQFEIDSTVELESSNTEEYNLINDNPFKAVKNNPLSTFSIDVDTASYSNLRRFITEGRLPPKDAVRIEELINYFTYDYPQPEANNPFSLTTEISDSPWNSQHKLVHVGIQGKDIVTENLPPSNLVFLLDVSGSMNTSNKLPLIKSAFQLLVDELTEKDTVSIVVYAGAAGVVLPPTKGNEKDKILAAINNLEAGGSTAGGEGIKLAYDLAKGFINLQEIIELFWQLMEILM